MIVIAGLVLGAALGALRAKKRGGNGKDMAQWAFVHALIFATAGLFITLFIHRSL
ncbi:hypothetical protein PSA7680_00224 [Pseudoruegeria aquimaris]|uniref:Uncharacterized protein n=1 Tax=Pseudoruegeria aquimaris TaxID=393663 RepID=A0A1Y5REP7_9RHOB|nr:hypothetical protein [Pseudoruegeria aquimaris]SLN12940.1 hypothetical protein PSA7680_00224 [Pseudoruegeria aquimaris]